MEWPASSEWLTKRFAQARILFASMACFMCHDAYGIVSTATDVASKILNFLRANHLKYELMVKLLKW